MRLYSGFKVKPEYGGSHRTTLTITCLRMIFARFLTSWLSGLVFVLAIMNTATSRHSSYQISTSNVVQSAPFDNNPPPDVFQKWKAQNQNKLEKGNETSAKQFMISIHHSLLGFPQITCQPPIPKIFLEWIGHWTIQKPSRVPTKYECEPKQVIFSVAFFRDKSIRNFPL